MKDFIDAEAFKEMVLCAENALREQTQLINDLNVFPVPDGDTGTNMGLTMKNAAEELKKRNVRDLSEAADCTANALLRGARGNSGVILSLLFRGISRRFKTFESAGAAEFAGALSDGVDAAYKAVMKPAEGTILTVSRLASKAAVEAASLGADLEGVFICAIKAGTEALAETQKINPVLKKAGVVDAGGKGFMVILEAMLASLRGEVRSDSGSAEEKAEEDRTSPFNVFDTEDITFAYDTVFIVRKTQEDVNIAPFRAYLDSIGDSLVISEGDEEFKVHVHTNIPGDALNEAAKYGTLELAKIENMRTQHDDVAAGRKARSTDDLEDPDCEFVPEESPEEEPEFAEAEKDFGVVAVCAGEGMEALFRELGADSIVTGGQTMNPSTDDILKAVNRTPASTVFVFPNNKNIIMAAEQSIPLTEKKVIVIPTKTVPQGITALLNFSPEGAAEEIAEAMTEAISVVHTAMVTYAARDSDFDGYDIHAGEYLSLLDGALIGSYRDEPELFRNLNEKISEFEPEFITVYFGSDVQEAEAESMADILREACPDAEVSVVDGGQPVYYYMVAVE
ncbi:MAG: DAK2 domain-containing protein [Eubacteriales bacterium]|nr:DAK2 domain-containing protein [Eubacteriales bacterium]